MARSLLTTALLVVLTLTPGQPEARAQAPRTGTISLDFPGGTAVEYVEAVRHAAGNLNVIVRPDASLVRIAPVELRRVDPDSALTMLDGLVEQLDDRMVRLGLEVYHSAGPDAHPLYALNAEVRTQLVRPPSRNQVWATTDLTGSGLEAEDMLTAIETSLDLLGDALPAVRLRYHRETGLLIARGHEEQLAAIDRVITALRASRPQQHETQREELRRFELEATERIAMLEQRLHATTDEMQQAVREVAVFQTRAELFEREIDALRERLEASAREHRAALAARDATIAGLRHRLLDPTDSTR